MPYKFPGFGPSRHLFLELRPGSKGGVHGGVDTSAPAGTPVYAEYDGTVYRSGPIGGYGMAVIVRSKARDGSWFYELYGHLGPGPLPKPGTPIKEEKLF